MADPKAAAPVEPQPKPQAAPQSDTTPSGDDTPPAPEKTYSQADLDRITAKVRKNAARDAELRFRRETQSASQPPAPKKDEPAPEDVEPKRDDFDTHEDYQRALTKYDATHAAREERKKAEEESRQRTEQEKLNKARDTWKGKVERAMAKHDDFEDVLEENAETFDLIANAPMRQFMTESDIGPEIAYFLCKTPEGRAEAKRIAELPGYKQAAEIAKLEEKLAPAAPPKPKDPPEGDDESPEEKKAREDRERDAGGRFKKDPPEPIEPGSGRPANNSALPSDKDDPETWRRKELARVRKREGK